MVAIERKLASLIVLDYSVPRLYKWTTTSHLAFKFERPTSHLFPIMKTQSLRNLKS